VVDKVRKRLSVSKRAAQKYDMELTNSMEKLTVTQLVKKFPSFYVVQRLITVFTTVHDQSLSWARWIRSTPSHPISL